MTETETEAALSPEDSAGIRPGEVRGELPFSFDASIYFIGRIRTPWATRAECPRRGAADGPVCRLEIDPRWAQALQGVSSKSRLQVLYWMDQARRDLLLQSPKRDGTVVGTFSIRSPVRPNPIASSVVDLVGVVGLNVLVRGLDCVD
ncbi:MAG: tRNA (N6-threonylcarbamoyladenosine(37)-N6)-methyltransferase TrmO, partial [Rhizobiales bacterium 32-66-8]